MRAGRPRMRRRYWEHDGYGVYLADNEDGRLLKLGKTCRPLLRAKQLNAHGFRLHLLIRLAPDEDPAQMERDLLMLAREDVDLALCRGREVFRVHPSASFSEVLERWRRRLLDLEVPLLPVPSKRDRVRYWASFYRDELWNLDTIRRMEMFDA